MMVENEQWLPVVGYEGMYEVSSLGRVRSLHRRVLRHDGFWQTHSARVLRQTIGTHGYPAVALCNGGKRGKTRTVHSIVAEAFLGGKPSCMQVRHLNGDRTDPRACNLHYGTAAENQNDRFMHGTALLGERNPNAKLKSADVLEIRRMLLDGEPRKHISKIFGVSYEAVTDIANDKRWGWM